MKRIKRYQLSPENNICWRSHQINHEYILPADVYLEMTAVAVNEWYGLNQYNFHDVRFLQKLGVNHAQETVTLELHAVDQVNVIHIQIFLMQGNQSSILFSSTLSMTLSKPLERVSTDFHYADDKMLKSADTHQHHKLGELYQSIKEFHVREKVAHVILQCSAEAKSCRDAFLTPLSIINGMFIAAIKFSAYLSGNSENVFVPANIVKLDIQNGFDPEQTYTLKLKVCQQSPEQYVYDALLVDNQGRCLLQAESVSLIKINNNAQAFPDNAIAIIGVAGKFPDANNTEAFWQNIVNGHCSVKDTCEERWNWADFYQPGIPAPGKTNCKHGSFLSNINHFAADFFLIPGIEAEQMDPQQRLFLETSWQALEDAGYTQDNATKSCGVFVGASAGDYLSCIPETERIAQSFWGNSAAAIPSRIAYHLNLHGPAMTVDTACSSSLLAVHLACQSITAGECEMAIAGGVFLMTTPDFFIQSANASMLSKQGLCSTFSENADGFVPGEAVGAIILKPLNKAIIDHDQIYAVIRASGVNQDGRSNGFTAPNPDAQSALINNLYAKHQIDPAHISLIEAHGTGTPLGDPVEVDALLTVFTGSHSNTCALGSVKTNLGHTATAAGITGLIKLIMAMKYKVIPPSLHAARLNPHIQLNNTPLYIPVVKQDWKPTHTSRMAAISSFGFSGTNVHLVLEEMKDDNQSNNEQAIYSIPVSAENQTIFMQYLRQILLWLNSENKIDMVNVVYTFTNRRQKYVYSGIFTVKTLADWKASLMNLIAGKQDERFTLAFVKSDSNLPVPGRAMSLPAYPMMRRSLWHQRTHDTSQQHTILIKISSSDHFIRDHVVNNNCIMPGVGYLFLLVNAISIQLHYPAQAVTIDEIIFHRPLIVATETDQVELSIKSENEFWLFEFSKNKVVYCSGRLQVDSNVDISPRKIIAEDGLNSMLSAQQLYDSFSASGIHYGSTMMPVQWIKHDNQHALAMLNLQEVSAHFSQPALLDGALQTLGAFIFNTQPDSGEPACLPFIMEGIQFYRPLPSRCFALAKQIGNYEYEISIFDEQHLLCAQLQRIIVRPMTALVPQHDWKFFHESSTFEPITHVKANMEIDTLILFIQHEHEREKILHSFHDSQCHILRVICVKSGNQFEQRSAYEFIINPACESDYTKLLSCIRTDNINVIHHGSFSGKNQLLVMALFTKACASLLLKSVRYLHVYAINSEHALNSMMLEGYIACLARELPDYTYQIIGLDEETDNTTPLVSEWMNQQPLPVTFYKNGQRSIKRLQPVPPFTASSRHNRLQSESTYIITGGLGGIGKKLAVYLARKYQSRILLIGRNISTLQQKWLSEVSQHHLIEFAEADVASYAEFHKVVDDYRNRHGNITAIFHAAGSINDRLIQNIDTICIEESIKAKVSGSDNILRLTEEFDISVIVLFSSLVSVLGNRGQSLYASANAYMNNLATLKNNLKTKWVSINWPYWQDGGMQAKTADIEYLLSEWKLQPLACDQGFAMLEPILQLDEPVVYIANQHTNFTAETHISHGIQAVDNESFLISLFAKELKILPERITPASTFDQLGLDSLLIVEITRKLEMHFGKLPTTLLFEFKSIKTLAEHLDKQYSTEHINPDTAPQTKHTETSNAIAIIGVHGIYPKANNLSEFWENLKAGVDCITEPPIGRFSSTPYHYGGFIEDIAAFDPLFFNITPRDAEVMDPQERIFLEVAWRALENAGYTKDELSQFHTGVFVGVMYGLYQLFGAEQGVIANSSFSSIPNRLSYFLDAQGPSIAYDTMCSSSLTALHAACQSIRNGECDIAIVGGVNIASHSYKYAELLQKNMLAEDGRCRSFGAGGRGYVPGEGVGVVILKSMPAALRDDDQIHAVIRGSAIGHDGRTHGYTVPNPVAQSSVVERALQAAGLEADTISYIEAHGTGTPLGDPIEIRGLQSAFSQTSSGKQYCAIGSVKSNIGHLESAAGIAGLTKIILQMQHQMLVPSLHSDSINPNIDFSNTAFYLQHELSAWPQLEMDGVKIPRRAGLSSFGAGGSNAHVILEEAPVSVRSAAYLSTKRKSLPPYSFQHKSYWIDQRNNRPDSYYLYRKEWIKHELQDDAGAVRSADHCYLILTSSDLLSEVELQLASFVTHSDQLLYLIYNQHNNTWILKHGGLTDELENEFTAYLLAYINSLHYTLHGLFDFIDVNAACADIFIPNKQRFELWQHVVLSYQQLNMSLFHFTTCLWDGRTLAGAVFSNFCKTLAAENAHVIAKHIDLSAWNDVHLASLIALELTHDIQQLEIRYQSHQRYLPQLVAHQQAWSHSPARFSKDGIYIVTGGTRGLGAEVARYLVNNGARHLFITGREPLPAKVKWDAILADNAAPRELQAKIQLIRDLEAKQCHVDLYFGELTQADDLEQRLREITRSDHPVKGWIHCAGSTAAKPQSLIFKKYEIVTQVLEPKTSGLQRLANTLANDKLDFIVLFSSVSSLVPRLSKGLGDYSAANAFMDHFGEWYRHQFAGQCHVLQWPLWNTADRNKQSHQLHDDTGLVTLSTQEGMRLLDSILQSKHSVQGMPAAALLNLPQDILRCEIKLAKNEMQFSADTDAVKIETSFITLVREALHSVTKLSLDELDNNRLFADYGIDSILLLELLNLLEKQLNIVISPTAIIDHDSVIKLAGYLESLTHHHVHAAAITGKATLGHISIQQHHDIAVIGVDVNLPGAPDNDRYWYNLTHHVSSLSLPSNKRMEELAPDSAFKNNRAGFIDEVGHFDADYFNFSDEQAMQLDPLCRHFLEVSVKAVANAGYTLAELSGQQIGVFTGSRSANYVDKIKPWGKSTIVGTGQNFIAAHLSHFANWSGPALVVDTACSSSLVSIHLACQSLINNETDMAIAGGVDLLIDERPFEFLAAAKALSATGQCRPFDRQADGLVPGEGAAAVLLKPLAKAIADGDNIIAVIQASAINNDGNTMGYTTPNPVRQKEVILSAWQRGKVNPEEIVYLETHGTGTAIGDPIELQALTSAFREYTQKNSFCAVGSVKANIGHLLSAAGIASFVKAAFVLRHRTLPPLISCENPNPRFDFAHSPLYLNSESVSINATDQPIYAGVSSFGFGGTNAHIVLRHFVAADFPDYQVRRSAMPSIIFNKKLYWPKKTSTANHIMDTYFNFTPVGEL
jgi:acyl transferase domain-containing protein/NAD(P)-dependent dehydrogenase (short-subunit alcohol dehydrogenase family)/acyl carrier protein